MKNTFFAMLLAVGLLSVAACKPQTKSEEATTPEETEQPSDEMTAPADSTVAADTASSAM
jgi:hypothetical protein